LRENTVIIKNTESVLHTVKKLGPYVKAVRSPKWWGQ